MPTEGEIKAKYKALHDELSDSYYKRHELSKEDFDTRHGVIWADLEATLIAAGYLTVPQPPRNLEAEIDELRVKVADYDKLKARLDKLEAAT